MVENTIFLLYASHDGHTRKIVERLAPYLSERGQAVSTYNLAECEPPSFMVEDAAAVLLFSPIRYGYHLTPIDTYIKKHKQLIGNDKLGLISINLTARKAEKNRPETNPYYKKWLKYHKVKPHVQAVFAGRLDYAQYKWWDKQLIRLIMSITGGPTALNTAIDYTNWAEVDVLAEQVIKLAVKKQEVA